ncbi:hypothetical protein M441DRAFT_418917 [Trichoderma asperellum CBS 433.97]|uniref:Uncharacterized protein n=1 Tax=Trichoderma asperellum (strain ATCC 204424 / CBS 433.97 / NBRC 101777) TaxID=1042311 RepID=A0A2T3Z8P9_TRIA4|nr:hypothetical protein M441DRAFT_418917 [Trichoderma asperellum CBS 433.97]PTB41160.1 hypothetical protein M441DRAFT_418917 [Trichoderma asperellum CBS 433.97]
MTAYNKQHRYPHTLGRYVKYHGALAASQFLLSMACRYLFASASLAVLSPNLEGRGARKLDRALRYLWRKLQNWPEPKC